MKKQEVEKIRSMQINPLIKHIEKLEKERSVEITNNHSEGQKKSNAIKKFKNEIAISKTLLNEKISEKVKDE